MVCPACGSPAPDGARFCPACGARLVVDAPPAVAADRTSRHERRLLTVLFADLVGFTASSDGADPEDVRGRVEPFHALVRRAAAATGGTVGRVVGDGVMVVWGYPVLREDDALRGIRAAVAIRDGVAALSGDRHVRIGINSGEAIVAFGSDDDRADDALGDALNVASRLAGAAPVDGILAGEATTRLAGDAVEAEAMPPLTLKGKAAPVAACLVTGVATHGPHDATGDGGGRFVGREAELETLWTALGAARDEDRVQRVLVTGDPGIGKSRLLRELRHAAHRHGFVPWYTGRCRPESGSPAWALGEIVKAWAGIGDDETADAATRRLEASLPASTGDRDWLRDRLGRLVGVGSAGSASADELAVAWTRFLALLADDGPAIVEIEDLHWADDELVKFVTSDALGSLQAALLVVVTGRPETVGRHPGLVAATDAHIALAALGEHETMALVADAGAGHALADDDRRALAERGGGNPLFTTELVRYVVQRTASGMATGDALRSLPDTVQAVIGARLDLLPPGVRAFVRDASVVGAAFWRGALVDLASLDPARDVGVDDALAALTDLGIVHARRVSTLAGDTEFAFAHALVRDVAYRQLTRADRAVRHAQVAAWLSRTSGPGRGDLAAFVADHDLAALDLAGTVDAGLDRDALVGHAVEHLLVAGANDAQLDPAAAASRFRQAAELAVNDEVRLQAMTGAVRAFVACGDSRDAVDVANVGIEVATRTGATANAGALLLLRSRARRPLGEDAWVDDVERARELLETAEPGPELVEAYAIRSFVEMSVGSGRACIEWAERAESLAHRIGAPQPGSAIVRRAFARAMFGESDSIADGERGVAVARAANDSAALANALSDLGGCHIYLGQPDRGLELLRAALEVARTRGLRGLEAQTLHNMGYVLRIIGAWADAEEAYAAAAAVAAGTQDAVRPIWIASDRHLLLHERGDDAVADALVTWMEAAVRALPSGTVVADETLAVAHLLVAGRRGDRRGVLDASHGIYLQEHAGDLDASLATFYLPVSRTAVRVGAPEVIERIVPTVSTLCPIGRAVHDTLLGLASAARGAHAAAADVLVSVIPHWDTMGYLHEAAAARQFAGESLLARGDREAGLRQLATAREMFERLGAGRGVRETDAAMTATAADDRDALARIAE